MKITVISDTHGMHNKLNLPGGDLLIHCGDALGHGNLKELTDFNFWLSQQDYQKIIFVPGNHDQCFQEFPVDASLGIYNAEVLVDRAFEFQGVKFYGTPWMNKFFDWSFMANESKLREVYSKIPCDTEFLITHAPPWGILDENDEGGYCGSSSLNGRIQELESLRYHSFGHIHEGYGLVYDGQVTYINASTCTRKYKPTNPPINFELV